MSTRANIVIKDDHEEVWFYRHSDGYPETVIPSLTRFLDWVKEGKIRDNVGQAAGWIIIIGNAEYQVGLKPNENDLGYGWKVGAYEPTTGQHGDIEHLYIVDLVKKTITHKEV